MCVRVSVCCGNAISNTTKQPLRDPVHRRLNGHTRDPRLSSPLQKQADMSHIHFAPQCGPLCSWSSGSSGSVNNRVNFRETERRATLSLTLGPIFSNLPSSDLFSITRTSPPAATSCTWIQIVGATILSSSPDRYGRAGDLPEK